MAAPEPLTFNAFATALGVMAVENTQTVGGVVEGVSAEFTANLPLALSYSELRIARDLQLWQLVTSDSSYSLIANSNLLTIAIDDFIAVETISINGTPLLPVSREWLQNVYGSNASPTQPMYFAPYGGDAATSGNTTTNYIVGPWPDSSYPLSITGITRGPSLYSYANVTDAGTKTTFLSSQMPDVLLICSMIFVAGFQRNFSSIADQPDMGSSWEQQYQKLINGAQVEEARRRFASSGWTAAAPTPVATPGR